MERRDALKGSAVSDDLSDVNSHERGLRVLALAAVVLALVLSVVFGHFATNSTLACGLAGAVFLHLGIRPDFRQIQWAVMVGAGYALLHFLPFTQFPTSPLPIALTIAACAGLGGITVLAYQGLILQSEPDIAAFQDALIVPLFSIGAGAALRAAQTFWPKTFDLYLYAFDASLRVSPAAAVNRWWQALPLLAILCSGAYAGILIFPALYRAWAVHSGIGREPSVLRSFLVAGLFGLVLNQCCPAAGPRYLFPGEFPDQMPALGTLTVAMTAVAGVRSAIPSLQTTWALLVWWSAWRLSWAARLAASFIVIFILLSAVGSGDHYLVDLIVAVPFTLGVEGLCRRGYVAAGLCFGLTLAWFILLRSGFRPHTPEIGWLLVAGTFLVCVACQIPLYRGMHTEEGLALSSRLTAMTAEKR